MKRLLIAIFLVAILLTIPFTTVTGSSVITASKKENQEKLNNIEIDDNEDTFKSEQQSTVFKKNKDDLKKGFTWFGIFINAIKLRFKNHPEIVSLCQQLLTKLNILGRDWPWFICFILEFIFFASEELMFVLLDLGFPILAELLYAKLLILDVIFMLHCSWMFPDGSRSIYSIRTLSEIIQSSKIRPCPCMQQ